jgi:hypothetical protein
MDVIIITHGLKGLPHYYFSGKDLLVLGHFSRKRTKTTRILKKQFNGKDQRCQGYFIDRKFKSLSSLERKKYPVTKILVKNLKQETPF